MNVSKINFHGSKINTLYFNDCHGFAKNINSFIQMRDSFYKENESASNFTLCGGDMFLEKNEINEEVALKLASVTDACTAGNHDLEGGAYLYYLINKFNLRNKWLGANLSYNRDTCLKNAVKKSIILKNNNEQIGVIGVSPFDFKDLVFANNGSRFINVEPLDKTLKIIRKEVRKLEDKNINKIVLLAHTGEKGKNGENYYKEFSKIGGIDLILGGHDHIEIDKWEVSERGEPVKIAATGKNSEHDFGADLDIAGKLNLEFDDNGVLIKDKCINTFENLSKPNISPRIKNELPVIYNFKKTPVRADSLNGYNEIGNLVADSNLWYVNSHTKGKKADFAFVNPGAIRADFENTDITKEDIKNVLPFITATLIKAPLTKKQIIDALQWCAISTTFPKVSPGMMQVSGIEYTVNADLKISDVHILNEDNTVKYNLDDFDDNEEFNAVYDTFLATGPAGLKDLIIDCENDKRVERFGNSRQAVLEDYLKNCAVIKSYVKERIKKYQHTSVRK